MCVSFSARLNISFHLRIFFPVTKSSTHNQIRISSLWISDWVDEIPPMLCPSPEPTPICRVHWGHSHTTCYTLLFCGAEAFHALKTGDPPGVVSLSQTTLDLECTWKLKCTLDSKGTQQTNKPWGSELALQCKIPLQLFKITISYYLLNL